MKRSWSALLTIAISGWAANAHAARIRVPLDSRWSLMELFLVLACVAFGAWVLGLPARWLGRRLHETGLREGCRWKVANGEALYRNSFTVMLLLVGAGAFLVSWVTA